MYVCCPLCCRFKNRNYSDGKERLQEEARARKTKKKGSGTRKGAVGGALSRKKQKVIFDGADASLSEDDDNAAGDADGSLSSGNGSDPDSDNDVDGSDDIAG
eukprot:3387730-Pleurochrysis_carterae.AAC.1